jgi:hypothetical protein
MERCVALSMLDGLGRIFTKAWNRKSDSDICIRTSGSELIPFVSSTRPNLQTQRKGAKPTTWPIFVVDHPYRL